MKNKAKRSNRTPGDENLKYAKQKISKNPNNAVAMSQEIAEVVRRYFFMIMPRTKPQKSAKTLSKGNKGRK